MREAVIVMPCGTKPTTDPMNDVVREPRVNEGATTMGMVPTVAVIDESTASQ